MGSPEAAVVPLPLLLPGYRGWTFDYTSGQAPGTSTSGRPLPCTADWVEVFRKSIPTYYAHACSDASVPDATRQAGAERFRSAYTSALDALLAAPGADLPGYSAVQPLSTLSMCRLREECLQAAGFGDIFKHVKDEENAKALQLLPGLLAELDAQPDLCSRLELALRGVFAGNIFDLGAQASAEAYASGRMAFAKTRAALVPRPWAVDHMGQLLELLGSGWRYNKAVMFVDNAGPDAVLGMLPLARELIKLGTQVVLAANERPVINDITATELRAVVDAAAATDGQLAAAVAAGALQVVSSGSDMPVIDLTKVSAGLAAACQGCDLLVLEGMGRAIETNLNERFTVDSLKLGMIKHPEVAACLDARLYDCVCKFDRVARS